METTRCLGVEIIAADWNKQMLTTLVGFAFTVGVILGLIAATFICAA